MLVFWWVGKCQLRYIAYNFSIHIRLETELYAKASSPQENRVYLMKLKQKNKRVWLLIFYVKRSEMVFSFTGSRIWMNISNYFDKWAKKNIYKWCSFWTYQITPSLKIVTIIGHDPFWWDTSSKSLGIHACLCIMKKYNLSYIWCSFSHTNAKNHY